MVGDRLHCRFDGWGGSERERESMLHSHVNPKRSEAYVRNCMRMLYILIVLDTTTMLLCNPTLESPNIDAPSNRRSAASRTKSRTLHPSLPNVYIRIALTLPLLLLLFRRREQHNAELLVIPLWQLLTAGSSRRRPDLGR